jgi:hypothetical protein
MMIDENINTLKGVPKAVIDGSEEDGQEVTARRPSIYSRHQTACHRIESLQKGSS